MVVELAEGVYWVGVVDRDIRHFHGYELSTHRGTTYNAYLIMDKQTILVDTVRDQFYDQFIENIRELTDPASIDIVVANHSELDHSGSLPSVMSHAKNATLIVSKRGEDSFKGHFHHEWNVQPVITGEKINIGKNDLIFIEAPMLHWPDSMFTYLTGHNILMPNDAFGQHYASSFRFNDEVNQKELYEEALKYYVNILTLYSDRVSKKIDEVLSLGLPVNIIAPSHGVIWRDDPLQIVRKYQAWASQEPESRAVILYATMWNATHRMAEAISDGLTDERIDHKIFNVAETDRNDALVEVFRSKMIIAGSPTLNYGVLPTITPLLESIRGLKFKNKMGAAFGSYGWSGESVKIIEQHFGKCNIPVAKEGIRCKWQPDTADLEKCRSFGRELGVKIKS